MFVRSLLKMLVSEIPYCNRWKLSFCLIGLDLKDLVFSERRREDTAGRQESLRVVGAL